MKFRNSREAWMSGLVFGIGLGAFWGRGPLNK